MPRRHRPASRAASGSILAWFANSCATPAPRRRSPRVTRQASRNRLDFDLGTERKSAGLEREPCWCGRNVGELPAPTGIEVSIVVDVAQHTLHINNVMD